MKKTAKFKIPIFIVSFVMLFMSVIAGYSYSTFRVPQLTDSQLEERDIGSADKLMIVAHPDDDVLWGGAHLMEGGYFVVVVTNANNAVRKQEYDKMLEKSGNRGMILSYPDKSYGKKDNWKHNKDGIRKDLEKIINYKHWDLIVTHNPEGEYGHIHHKMTNGFVTDIYKANKEKLDTSLYYFGRYYTKTKIGDVDTSIPYITDEQLKFKEDLLTVYKSQSKTVDMFSHMNRHEDWVLCEDWK